MVNVEILKDWMVVVLFEGPGGDDNTTLRMSAPKGTLLSDLEDQALAKVMRDVYTVMDPEARITEVTLVDWETAGLEGEKTFPVFEFKQAFERRAAEMDFHAAGVRAWVDGMNRPKE